MSRFPDTSPEASVSLWIRGRSVGVGALVGALYGAADALAVVFGDASAYGPAMGAALVALDAASCGLLGALAGLVARRARGSWPLAGALALAAVGLVHGTPLWFQPPAPFVAPPPLLGRPLPFLGLVSLGLAVLALSARLLRARPRVALGLLVVTAVAWVAAAARRPSAAAPSPPGATSILLITIDTTRADHVGAWGSTVKTPNIDRIAAEGARFTDAMAQIPVTGPSHLTMMSGAGPWTHGTLLNGAPVPVALPLMSERLGAAGWRTGAFVSSFVLDGRFGLSRGFDVYDDEFSALAGWTDTIPGRLIDRVAAHLHPEREVERRADATVDRALGWLDNQGDAPFFAWVHLFDPHGPYHPPSPWDTAYYQGDPRDPRHESMSRATNVAPYLLPSLKGITDLDFVLAQYAGEVSYADQELGRLLDWLDARGRADSTLVVIAGDHGESLGEHEVWFNHGDDLYEPSVHVPLALRLPGRVPAGTVLTSPVELTDVAPTALGLIGQGAPMADGVDLSPWLSGQRSDPPRPFARSIAWDRPANLEARASGASTRPIWRVVALRAADGRYVLRETVGAAGAWYEHANDPGETSPAPPPPDRIEALSAAARAMLDAHRISAGLEGPPPEAMDAETEEKLRALGYIEE